MKILKAEQLDNLRKVVDDTVIACGVYIASVKIISDELFKNIELKKGHETIIKDLITIIKDLITQRNRCSNDLYIYCLEFDNIFRAEKYQNHLMGMFKEPENAIVDVNNFFKAIEETITLYTEEFINLILQFKPEQAERFYDDSIKEMYKRTIERVEKLSNQAKKELQKAVDIEEINNEQ